jgi:hypothetical protein
VALAGTLRQLPLLRDRVEHGQVGVQAARQAGAALRRLTPHLDRPDGLLDGLPAEAVVAAVVRNTVPLVAGARLGLRPDDPRLGALLARTEQIIASGDSEAGKLEAAFVLLAQQVPLALLPRALAEQRDALLPSELEDRAERAHQQRDLRLQPSFDQQGGRIVIDADDELYELLWTALHAGAQHDPANPSDTLHAARLRGDGHEPYDPDLALRDGVRRPRSKGQRRHDALTRLLQRYLDAGLAGTLAKTPVSIHVTLTQPQVEDRPGALPGTGPSGRPLPRSLLRRWWCDAKVTAFVLSRGLLPLGVVHTGRTLNATERKATYLQHGGTCAGLGCCSPHDPLVQLVPHHVLGYAKYGGTSLAHTVLVCDRLHHDLHHGKTVPLRNGHWLNEHGWTQPPAGHR